MSKNVYNFRKEIDSWMQVFCTCFPDNFWLIFKKEWTELDVLKVSTNALKFISRRCQSNQSNAKSIERNRMIAIRLSNAIETQSNITHDFAVWLSNVIESIEYYGKFQFDWLIDRPFFKEAAMLNNYVVQHKNNDTKVYPDKIGRGKQECL